MQRRWYLSRRSCRKPLCRTSLSRQASSKTFSIPEKIASRFWRGVRIRETLIRLTDHHVPYLQDRFRPNLVPCGSKVMLHFSTVLSILTRDLNISKHDWIENVSDGFVRWKFWTAGNVSKTDVKTRLLSAWLILHLIRRPDVVYVKEARGKLYGGIARSRWISQSLRLAKSTGNYAQMYLRICGIFVLNASHRQ